MQRRARDRQAGQSLVVVTIFLTVLLGFAAVAVDAGRFFSERRFLQNTADAAALAAATALSQGATTSEAIAVARNVIAINYTGEPTGSPPNMPSTTPIYAEGHEGEGSYLLEGIRISNSSVRVALRNPVDYTFGRAVGLVEQEISAHARADNMGGLLPIAVRQFITLPGPNVGATTPCSGNDSEFLAVFATADTSCLGSMTDASGRANPSSGADFDSSYPGSDPAHHGPIVEILGQGAEPWNAADFRGYITLDIRNFSNQTSQRFFNGVTAGWGENETKNFEAEWIRQRGYPGPMFPAIANPPDPNDQVSIMSGNSAGVAIDAVKEQFVPGDEILIAVYPGYTMVIPEFAMSLPALVELPTTGVVSNAGSIRVSRNQAFTGLVTLTAETDPYDPDHPMNQDPPTLVDDGGGVIDFDPNPISPMLGMGKVVDLRDLETSGAKSGIYTVWIKGQAGEPYLQAERVPLSIKIGNVNKDFAITPELVGVSVTPGTNAFFNLSVTNAPSRNTNFGGNVSLSLDPNSELSGSFSSTSVSPTGGGTTVTLTVPTAGVGTGDYDIFVRATGENSDATPHNVTHLLALKVVVDSTASAGDDDYLDMTGWAVMRIAEWNANTIYAYAITPVITDLDDYRLRRGQKPRLRPW